MAGRSSGNRIEELEAKIAALTARVAELEEVVISKTSFSIPSPAPLDPNVVTPSSTEGSPVPVIRPWPTRIAPRHDLVLG